MNSGVPVLIMLGEVGPIAGIFQREYREIELFEGDAGFTDARPGAEGAWNVVVDDTPARYLHAVAKLAEQLGPAVEVRIWASPVATHYVGRAYVQRPTWPLAGSSERHVFTVLGQGQLDLAPR